MLTLAEIKKRIKPFKGEMYRTIGSIPEYIMRWELDGWELCISEAVIDRLRFRMTATIIVKGLEASK